MHHTSLEDERVLSSFQLNRWKKAACRHMLLSALSQHSGQCPTELSIRSFTLVLFRLCNFFFTGLDAI